MRSSSGQYYSRLDHVRALAAFVVFFWHFVHVFVPFSHVPDLFVLSLLEEGHAGVALFMTLSGYLFAKIIDGRDVDLPRFYWNRFIRLAPLLALALAYWAARGRMDASTFLTGFLTPSWPGGAWSIVVEFHFYLVFPLILALQRRAPVGVLVALLTASVAFKAGLAGAGLRVQDVSYWTLVGCLDLFVAGMLWHELAGRAFIRRHASTLMFGCFIGLAGFWHAFNMAGGFFGGGAAVNAWWIVIPAVQGLAFGGMIVGYENSQIRLPRLIDSALARVGEASYSLYLLHFMVFTFAAKLCAQAGLAMQDFTVSALMAVAVFPVMALAAIASYRLIERPFLALRCGYLKEGGRRSTALSDRPSGPARPAPAE